MRQGWSSKLWHRLCPVFSLSVWQLRHHLCPVFSLSVWRLRRRPLPLWSCPDNDGTIDLADFKKFVRRREVRPSAQPKRWHVGRADRACNHLFSSAVAREERSNEDDLAIAQPKRWHVGRVASGSTVSLVRRAVSTVRVAIIDCRQ